MAGAAGVTPSLVVLLAAAATLLSAWRHCVIRSTHRRHVLTLTVGGRDVDAAVYDEPGEPGRVAAAVARAIGG